MRHRKHNKRSKVTFSPNKPINNIPIHLGLSVHASTFSFPAAPTTCTPMATRAFTAASMTSLVSPGSPPTDILITVPRVASSPSSLPSSLSSLPSLSSLVCVLLEWWAATQLKALIKIDALQSPVSVNTYK